MTDAPATARRQIELVPLSELRADPRNPKAHDTKTIDSSATRFGFIESVVRDDRTGFLISGHGRTKTLKAMHAAGSPAPDGVEVRADGEWLVPTSVGWSSTNDDEAGAALIALNRAGELGGWDSHALMSLLDSLNGNLAGTGYDAADLSELMSVLEPDAPTELTDRNAAPARPLEPVSQVGDVWQLGPHRVLCGDSTDAELVASMLEGDRPDCVWTDPPYGVEYVGGTADKLTIMNDGADDLPGLLLGAFATVAEVARPGAPVYVAHADTERIAFETAMVSAGLIVRQNLIWVKNSLVLGHADYHYKHEPILEGAAPGDLVALESDARDHEPILYGFTDGGEGRLGRGGARWHGDNKQTTVIECDRPKSSAEHPTMKPVDLILLMLGNSLRVGGLVLDLFGGSGSTLIAAHHHRSRAALVELDPKYVDVICKRWQQHTGVVPVLVSTGEPHDFIGLAA